MDGHRLKSLPVGSGGCLALGCMCIYIKTGISIWEVILVFSHFVL
jgi:hypothetical protein